MIFVDTSVFVAVTAFRDARHEDGRRLMADHGSSGLVTSNHVRGETCTFLNRRYGHWVAVAFLDMVEKTKLLEVVTVETALEEKALRWLRRHDEREFSFVDATSFELMRSLRIREALAFDGDFAAAGFIELQAEGHHR